MNLEQLTEGIHFGKFREQQIALFMNDLVLRSTNHQEAIANVTSILSQYELEGPLAFLPDLTNANSLPTGTTALIKSTTRKTSSPFISKK